MRYPVQFAFVAILCATASTPALSQVDDDIAERERAAAEELYQRFEAERRRQERVRLGKERLQREKIRLQNERLRQENERREQERLRLEIEGLRQENENRRLERLRLEDEARERERLRLEDETRERERLRLEDETRERERLRSAAVPSDAGSIPDIYEQLRAIGQLKSAGILTEEEFQRLKRKILE